jgi:hypothetical protein
MQAQATHTQLSLGVVFLLAAVLLIGASVGYGLRGIGVPVSGAQAAPAAGETTRTVLIPRSAREDDAGTVQGNQLIPRTAREGLERADGTR